MIPTAFLPPHERRMAEAQIVVVGPPSSGTRLVFRLLLESGKRVLHDGSHGGLDVDPAKVVRVERDREARIHSALARTDSPAFLRITTRVEAEQWMDGIESTIAERYPVAPVISYEALVEDRDAELSRISAVLGLAPWTSTIEVYDANAPHMVTA